MLLLNIDNHKMAGVPAVLAVHDKVANNLHIISSFKPLGFLEQVMIDLKNNVYRNRNIQAGYNQGHKIEFYHLESINIESNLPHFLKSLLLKLKCDEWASKLETVGRYNVIPVYNVAKFQLKIEDNRHGIQVVVYNSRNKKYYVQKPFNDIETAYAYVDNTDLFQALKDSRLCRYPHVYKS